MTRQTKVRTGWHQATPNTSESTCNSTGIASRIKAVIVTMALWGLIPVGMADWIIDQGGLRDV